MPSADQVPVNNPHSTMLWPMWVVLIAGSTGSALRAVRPPNLHITSDVRRDLVYAASAAGSLYRSSLAIIAHAIRASLLASAMAATLVGRRASNAVSQGRCLVPWIRKHAEIGKEKDKKTGSPCYWSRPCDSYSPSGRFESARRS